MDRAGESQEPECGSCTAQQRIRQRFARYLEDQAWWMEAAHRIRLGVRGVKETRGRISRIRMDCEDDTKRKRTKWMGDSTTPAQTPAKTPCNLLLAASSSLFSNKPDREGNSSTVTVGLTAEMQHETDSQDERRLLSEWPISRLATLRARCERSRRCRCEAFVREGLERW